jgi:hypothetical protein
MLKVVCQFKPNGEFYRHLGFANALVAGGNDFFFWYPEKKPLIDILDELKPDIFIGTTFDLNRSIINALNLHPEVKVVLKGGNWGEHDDEIDRKKYPIVFISEQEKKILAEWKEKVGKPDYVMCHYHGSFVDGTMGLWRTIGIEPIDIMNAADTVIYGRGTKNPEFQCDVSFVGGYWPYKAQNIDRYLIPLCQPKSNLNVKIFGNMKWSVQQYLGLINDNDVKNLYASSKICPNVSESHSNVYGFDLVERPFKILSSGGFLLMDDVIIAKQLFGDTVNFYHDPKDFFEKIVHFLKNPQDRVNDKAIELVYKEHTYFHRMAYLLFKLGYESEAKQVILAGAKYNGCTNTK